MSDAEVDSEKSVSCERPDEELVFHDETDGATAHRRTLVPVEDLLRHRDRIYGNDLKLDRAGALGEGGAALEGVAV